MKYRIVERKDNKGCSSFTIERKRFLFWRKMRTELFMLYSHNDMKPITKAYSFFSCKHAIDTLKRYLKGYSYKGVAIYPTVKDDEFYVLKWSKRKRFLFIPYGDYQYMINGSYENCCQEILAHQIEDFNKKFKKIIKLKPTDLQL